MAKIPAKIPARIEMTIHVCRLISTFATMKSTTENNIEDSIPGVNETRHIAKRDMAEIKAMTKNSHNEIMHLNRAQYKILLNAYLSSCHQLQTVLAELYSMEQLLGSCIVDPVEEPTQKLDLERAVKAVADAQPQIATKGAHFIGIAVLAQKRGYDINYDHFAFLISKYFRGTIRQTISDAYPLDFKGNGEDIDGWLKLNKFSQKLVRITEVAKIASPFIPNLKKTS